MLVMIEMVTKAVIALMVIGIAAVLAMNIAKKIRAGRKTKKVIKVSKDLEKEKDSFTASFRKKETAPVREPEPVAEDTEPEETLDKNHTISRLYIYKLERKVWVCRYCETENEFTSQQCVVCGRYSQEDQYVS